MSVEKNLKRRFLFIRKIEVNMIQALAVIRQKEPHVSCHSNEYR
jgi:hypothetical protein